MEIYEARVIKKITERYEPVTKLAPVKVKVNNEVVVLYNIIDKVIVFQKPLAVGDLLTIEFNSDLSKVFTKSKYGTGAIYKLYSEETKLKFNSSYKFLLEVKETHEIEFKSKYDPFYSTIKLIRNDTGDLFENVSDEIIASVIYDNSMLVVDKLGENTEVIEDTIPMYIKNFVRYKTDIDLCYAIYLSKTGKVGSFKKKLGDLDVSSEVKLPYLSDMLSRFKELLRPNEELLEGGNADLTIGFVKGKSTTYPVTSRGVF